MVVGRGVVAVVFRDFDPVVVNRDVVVLAVTPGVVALCRDVVFVNVFIRLGLAVGRAVVVVMVGIDVFVALGRYVVVLAVSTGVVVAVGRDVSFADVFTGVGLAFGRDIVAVVVGGGVFAAVFRDVVAVVVGTDVVVLVVGREAVVVVVPLAMKRICFDHFFTLVYNVAIRVALGWRIIVSSRATNNCKYGRTRSGIFTVHINIHSLFCLFVLRFYGPVNPMGSCRARSVYVTTRLLGRLSPLNG